MLGKGYLYDFPSNLHPRRLEPKPRGKVPISRILYATSKVPPVNYWIMSLLISCNKIPGLRPGFWGTFTVAYLSVNTLLCHHHRLVWFVVNEKINDW